MMMFIRKRYLTTPSTLKTHEISPNKFFLIHLVDRNSLHVTIASFNELIP